MTFHPTEIALCGALDISRAEKARWDYEGAPAKGPQGYDEEAWRIWGRLNKKSFGRQVIQTDADYLLADLLDTGTAQPAPDTFISNLLADIPKPPPTFGLDPGSDDALEEGRRIRNQINLIKLAEEKKRVIATETLQEAGATLGREHVNLIQEFVAALPAQFPELDSKVVRDRIQPLMTDFRKKSMAVLDKLMAEYVIEKPVEQVMAEVQATTEATL